MGVGEVPLTRVQQEEQANDQLAKKHALEAAFLLLLRKIFRRMARDMSENYTNNGSSISAFSYKSEFNELLIKLYNDTSNKFKTVLDGELNSNPELLQSMIGANQPLGAKQVNDFVEQLAQQANESIQAFIKGAVLASNTQITSTNQNDIQTAFAFAIASQVKDNLTRKQTAKVMQDKAMQLFEARTKVIAVTQVQNASESTKNIVADEFNKIIKLSTGRTNTLQKIWLTRMDDKVRLSHREANLQVVPFNEPYIVEGQQLNYPGDWSLGATADNIIGCRCVSIPTLI